MTGNLRDRIGAPERAAGSAVPGPVMKLLESAWDLIESGRGAASWETAAAEWGERFEALAAGYAAAAKGEPAPGPERPAAPPPRLANVEVKGFRDLGVVAVSEITLAGVPFLHAESRDGSSADFPASSVHFIAWLPPGSPWPEKPKAIAAPDPWTYEPDDAPDDDRDEWHRPGCPNAGGEPDACGCAQAVPF